MAGPLPLIDISATKWEGKGIPMAVNNHQKQHRVRACRAYSSDRLTMIAIGGVIGAGLFTVAGRWSSAETGPEPSLTYALCGVLIIMVVQILGEMSVATPDHRLVQRVCPRGARPWAGFP